MKFYYLLFILLQVVVASEDISKSEQSHVKLIFMNKYQVINEESYWKTLKAIYPNGKEKVLIEESSINVVKNIGDLWSPDGLYFMYGMNLNPGIINDDVHSVCEVLNIYTGTSFFVNINNIEEVPKLSACKVDWDLDKKHTLVYQELIEFGENGENDKFKINSYEPILDIFNYRYNVLSQKFKEKKSINIIKKFSLEKLDIFLENISIRKNLTKYNNIAYYLQKANANKEAVYLLEKILEKYPNRTVAHYNLADAYWELGEKKKAISSYRTYMEQMKEKGKTK
ncbi:MAG TPA: tetratricopeptide repeat protein, partial [Flavobacteriaceae bacterium]|nr:tetratricopeptide repeat protein [Flavobacteriaceae bacterium]